MAKPMVTLVAQRQHPRLNDDVLYCGTTDLPSQTDEENDWWRRSGANYVQSASSRTYRFVMSEIRQVKSLRCGGTHSAKYRQAGWTESSARIAALVQQSCSLWR